jgi:hypothetical protein
LKDCELYYNACVETKQSWSSGKGGRRDLGAAGEKRFCWIQCVTTFLTSRHAADAHDFVSMVFLSRRRSWISGVDNSDSGKMNHGPRRTQVH